MRGTITIMMYTRKMVYGFTKPTDKTTVKITVNTHGPKTRTNSRWKTTVKNHGGNHGGNHGEITACYQAPKLVYKLQPITFGPVFLAFKGLLIVIAGAQKQKRIFDDRSIDHSSERYFSYHPHIQTTCFEEILWLKSTISSSEQPRSLINNDLALP